MKVKELNSFKQKALQWASTFEVCCCYDSSSYPDKYGKFDYLIAAGNSASLNASAGSAFDQLKAFYNKNHQWMFGLLSYDLKNEIEPMSSSNADGLEFPDLYFFVPEYLMLIKGDEIEVVLGDSTLLMSEITQTLIKAQQQEEPELGIDNKISKEAYIEKIEAIKEHIARGDIYEINYCQEFFSENAVIDPLSVYRELNRISPTPFAGFFKLKDKYILSASPERFICKRGETLISQPIKGTARRNADHFLDQQIKEAFKTDVKEQAENVMIVDLVRNDLTKSAVKGSVQVEELFGIYGFTQVYQMISTISCRLSPTVHLIDAIRNAFPMGSMTGAPKVKAMQLIEQYELSKRGMYSGAFGYITPDGDFDFNVIIRSILYNATEKYLSFQVGGAITYNSIADKEYEECLLKASAIIQTLKKPQ